MDTSQLTLRINTEGMSEAQKGMDGLANTAGMLESMITKLAAAFAAWRLATFAQEATMLAARYETLGVAMEAVGRNAGYTAQQMAGFQGGLEKTGISMIESRNSLTMLAAAQINLADSSKLARVAQDAAVIGGLNSSEAFGRMIQGIRSGQIETLRTIGINVQFEDGYKKMADQLGKNVKSLTDLEKTQSRANQVIDYGARLAGAYEASMETAGKQIFSMQRYIQDLEVKLGAIFGPALQKMVFDFVDQLKRMSQALDAMQKSGQLLNLMNGLRDSIGSVVGRGRGQGDVGYAGGCADYWRGNGGGLGCFPYHHVGHSHGHRSDGCCVLFCGNRGHGYCQHCGNRGDQRHECGYHGSGRWHRHHGCPHRSGHHGLDDLPRQEQR